MLEIDKIVDSLTKENIEIADQYTFDENKNVIFTDYSILHYDSLSKVLSISFNVSASPDVVSKQMLLLKRIRGIKLEVVESFWYDEKYEMISGEKAYKEFNKDLTNKIIEDFVRNQSQIHSLHVNKGYVA